MASRVETFDVLIPASTPIATPQNTPLVFNDGVVQRMEILIPPGPSGLVGFRVTHSGDVVIPYNRSNWVIADDDTLKWDLENYPTGSAWGLTAYNTDVYMHTLYIRIFVTETMRVPTGSVPALAIAQTAPSEIEPGTQGE